MRYWGKIFAFVVLLGALGCAGSSSLPQEQQVTLQSIAGSAVNDVQLTQAGQTISLEIAKLDPEGAFFRIELPDGKTVAEEKWQNDENVIHLVVPLDGIAEIGVVPLRTYSGDPVNAKLTLGPEPKAVKTPPQSTKGDVFDLTVTYSREDYVWLDWTEVNNGDYDFNGQVGISDLTPIGQHFGESYDVAAPNKHLNQLFWIDGDRNGMITQGDITPIGANFNSTIGGYSVIQDGNVRTDPLAWLPTVKRDSDTYVTMREKLPPVYRIELGGTGNEKGLVTDLWQVVPVDWGFSEGPNPGTNLFDASLVDLSTNVVVTGTPLLDLQSEISSSPSGSFEILRVVDPGEIVNVFEVGERLAIAPLGESYFASADSGRFVDVPRDSTLLLEVIYAPAVNLATGEPKAGSAASDEDIVFTAIPFRLPPLNELVSPIVADLDVAIDLTENPAGGYFVNLHITQTIQNTENDISTVTETITRLAYATGLVSRLSEPGGDFEDEAQLSDEDRDGISEAHLDELNDTNIYSAIWSYGVKYTGTIAAFNEAAGMLHLTDAVRVTGGGDIYVGELEVMFSENTKFGEIDQGGNPDDPGTIDPSDLMAGDELVLGVYIYNDPPKYWANIIVRQLPE